MSRSPDPSPHDVAIDLKLAVGQLVRRLRAQMNSGELTLSQLSAMARLEAQGPMTTADLARAESVKPQSMGAILAGLEAAGFVERHPHPTDGRQILFALTPLGMKERKRRSAAQQQWMEAALARLSEKELQILATATPLLKRLSDG
ncbi:MAG: MarR family transcriptional regulator [Betaproteobacteria bacterium]|nr:MarR family transcriptional regulator [Betaproteobacteria bacterium]